MVVHTARRGIQNFLIKPINSMILFTVALQSSPDPWRDILQKHGGQQISPLEELDHEWVTFRNEFHYELPRCYQ